MRKRNNRSLTLVVKKRPIFQEYFTSSIPELNADIQVCVISSNNKATNNKNKTNKINQEANHKQKGRQFTLSWPVVIPTMGQPFLQSLLSQGEKSC